MISYQMFLNGLALQEFDTIISKSVKTQIVFLKLKRTLKPTKELLCENPESPAFGHVSSLND